MRQLLEVERQGVLATLSARHAGWPFASVTPFALTEAGEPLLLFSELAEHTRNVRADPRVSLLVQDAGAADDPQAGARLTLLGTLEASDDRTQTQRYVERHPQAAEYLKLGDFHLWRLQTAHARFVSGFGDMGWLEGDPLRVALAGR